MWIVQLALRRTYTFVVVALLIAVLGAVSKKGVMDLPEPRPLRTLLAEIGPTERADLSQIRVRYPDGSARTAG